ncbi:hypothetical protein [Bosea sp. 117]|nr:hypothetical protein [Bosea sp. 117]
MLDAVFPVLPALIVCHAWVTILMVQVLSDDAEIFSLPPESFPV